VSIGGIEQIDSMQAVLRALESSGPEMAAAGTQALFNVVSADVAAGKDPNTGAAFEPTKKGERPLKNAAKALSWRIVGNIGFLVLSQHYTFHFLGTGYLPRRRANLQGRLPDRYGIAIQRGMVPVFQAKTKIGKIGTKRYNAWKAKREAKAAAK
jgi:hypothetical protein